MENNNCIAIYGEGGIGDILFAHHKTWILKETLYPTADFSIFLDTEGNPMQERVLKYLFPNFYKEIFTIPSKKYKKMVIQSQFGEETVKGFWENLPDYWQAKLCQYDKQYNFHIDSLRFIDYPELQWAKYHKTFPRPETKNIPINMIGDFFLSNLWSKSGTEHVIEQFWSDRLILQIDELAQKLNYRHLIISTPELNKKYEHLIPKLKMSMIVNTEVEDICNYISHCKGVIMIDSAWRLVAHMYDKPTITISKNCLSRGNVPISHQLRWLPFEKTTFPIHSPTNDIIKLFEKILENQIYEIYPELAYVENVDNSIIKRNYAINLEKSIARF